MPHLHVSVFRGWANSCPFKRLETRDAIGTRLAVYGRLRLYERARLRGVCVGVPAAQFCVQARLPYGRSPHGKWSRRRIAAALGTEVSLSTQRDGQIKRRWSGCHSSIRPSFSSRQRRRRSPTRKKSGS